jgi:hypothetical protein
MKNLGDYIKRFGKAIGMIVLCAVVAFAMIYFAKCYIGEDFNLSFTPEDRLMLLILGIIMVVMIINQMFVLIRLDRQEKAIYDIYDTIAEVEDNIINLSRDTQTVLLDAINKFGVGKFEKKS